jgi:hypothetical protein
MYMDLFAFAAGYLARARNAALICSLIESLNLYATWPECAGSGFELCVLFVSRT